MVIDEPADYWLGSDAERAGGTYRDRIAAARVNLDNREQNAQPFGAPEPTP